MWFPFLLCLHFRVEATAGTNRLALGRLLAGPVWILMCAVRKGGHRGASGYELLKSGCVSCV